MFAAARVAAQGALDRGELAQALSILSEWHGDPSLTPTEAKEVDELLSQLAGSVIYEGPPAHRLAAPHIVQFGETLQTIAAKYDVPWQLLAKINGVADPSKLTQGQVLKVVPGPFSALIDLSERTMTLMLDRRYAGEFAFEIEPTATVEEGEWKVDQKQLTPAISGLYSAPGADTEDRSLRLANLANPTGAPAIVRGPGAPDPVSAAPRDRVLKLKTSDMGDVFDILSEGSRVTIRR
jgi:LysM repeat protein